MADMYLQDWSHYGTQIAVALAAADAALLRRHAHTIKSLLATFVDDHGAALASVAEQQARDGNLSALPDLVPKVQERLRLVAAALGPGKG
ncbi:MAG: Hpt [Rhodocyclaceae bacterium]|nr:Hpt [Rhodocyclaceae bacterium]